MNVFRADLPFSNSKEPQDYTQRINAWAKIEKGILSETLSQDFSFPEWNGEEFKESTPVKVPSQTFTHSGHRKVSSSLHRYI
jgi:hypothetical protein